MQTCVAAQACRPVGTSGTGFWYLYTVFACSQLVHGNMHQPCIQKGATNILQQCSRHHAATCSQLHTLPLIQPASHVPLPVQQVYGDQDQQHCQQRHSIQLRGSTPYVRPVELSQPQLQQ